MLDALERGRQGDRVVGALLGEQCIGSPQFGPGEGRFTQVVQFLEECETELRAILRMKAGPRQALTQSSDMVEVM